MEQVRFLFQGFDASDQGDFGKITDGYSITTRLLHTTLHMINPPALAHALPESRTRPTVCWVQLARGVDAEGGVSIIWLTLLGG